MLSCLTLDQWQELVELHPYSTALHHRNWMELLIDQYAMQPYIPAIMRAGRVVAAVPFLKTRGLSGSRKLISLPFTDCVRILACDEEALEDMHEGLKSESFDDYKAVVIRTDTPLHHVSCQSPWVRHELSVGRPMDEIADIFPASLKRNLRKADKSNLSFERRHDADAMESFYRLHLMTRKKHGVPIQPKSFFRRLQRLIIQPGLGFVGLVSRNAEPIAAGVFLNYNKTLIYKYGASNPQSLEHRPNEYLFYNVIRWAHEENYLRMDFGVSKRSDEGLRRFKRKWGATESDVYHEYVAGVGPTPVDDSLAFKMASVAIRHFPPIVCQALGELLYRYSQ